MPDLSTAEPVRVLRVIARLNIGGPAIHVILTAEGLRSRGYDTTLVCGPVQPPEGDMMDLAHRQGVHAVLLPQLGRAPHPLRDLVSLWRLWRLMRRVRPDIVHTHTAKAGFVGRMAARLAGVPVVVHTFHGHVFEGYFGRAATGLFLQLERLAARGSTCIVTLSERLRCELTEVHHVARPEKVEVIPLGLDLRHLAVSPRRQGDFRRSLDIPQDVPLVGIVGRLVPIKRHELLIVAAGGVREAFPDARFAVIGDGELRSNLEARAAAIGLEHAFHFAGWRSDLEAVYSDLDLCVLCSRNEGTPVSVIEALTAGCPVVATDVGGVADILGQETWGRLVPPEDPAALAEAIVAILRDPPDVGSARRIMPARYGVGRLLDDLDALYRRLLAQAAR